MQFKAEIITWETLVKDGVKLPIQISKEERANAKHIYNFRRKPIIFNFIKGSEVLNLKGRLKKLRKRKGGLKAVLNANSEFEEQILKHMHKFEDQIINVELEIDAEARRKEINTISHKQRSFAHAIFSEIAEYTGYTTKEQKYELKRMYCEKEGYKLEEFSFSDMRKDVFNDFMEFIGILTVEWGIILEEVHAKDLFADAHKYVWMCLKNKKCAKCGKTQEAGRETDEHGNTEEQIQTHHVDTIGMGNDRTKLDDSDKRKISLCGYCHNIAENMSWEKFSDKYQLVGVIYNGWGC